MLHHSTSSPRARHPALPGASMVRLTTSLACDQRSATPDRRPRRWLVANHATIGASGWPLLRAAVSASRCAAAAARNRPCASSSTARASEANRPFFASPGMASSRFLASIARAGVPPGTRSSPRRSLPVVSPSGLSAAALRSSSSGARRGGAPAQAPRARVAAAATTAARRERRSMAAGLARFQEGGEAEGAGADGPWIRLTAARSAPKASPCPASSTPPARTSPSATTRCPVTGAPPAGSPPRSTRASTSSCTPPAGRQDDLAPRPRPGAHGRGRVRRDPRLDGGRRLLSVTTRRRRARHPRFLARQRRRLAPPRAPAAALARRAARQPHRRRAARPGPTRRRGRSWSSSTRSTPCGTTR